MDAEPAPIEWRQAPGEFESLAVALRAVLSPRGVAVDYDELVSVLGLGAALVAASDEPDAARWSCYARDAFLVESAALYGLRLRELHPPDAAAGLERSREFSAHFRDSYAPLIRRGSAHGQVALAWRGWDAGESECSDEWGVIFREQDDAFEGFAGNCGGRIATLREPAEQVYLVEAHEPVLPDETDWRVKLSAAARHSAAYWRGVRPRGDELQSGPAAFEFWRASERKLAAHDPGWSHERRGEFMRRLSAARRSLGRWLRTAANHAAGHLAARARDAATFADLAADRFEREMSHSDASDPQAQYVERLQERDERLVEKLKSLAPD